MSEREREGERDTDRGERECEAECVYVCKSLWGEDGCVREVFRSCPDTNRE